MWAVTPKEKKYSTIRLRSYVYSDSFRQLFCRIIKSKGMHPRKIILFDGNKAPINSVYNSIVYGIGRSLRNVINILADQLLLKTMGNIQAK
jgi:hypothetical protein